MMVLMALIVMLQNRKPIFVSHLHKPTLPARSQISEVQLKFTCWFCGDHQRCSHGERAVSTPAGARAYIAAPRSCKRTQSPRRMRVDRIIALYRARVSSLLPHPMGPLASSSLHQGRDMTGYPRDKRASHRVSHNVQCFASSNARRRAYAVHIHTSFVLRCLFCRIPTLFVCVLFPQTSSNLPLSTIFHAASLVRERLPADARSVDVSVYNQSGLLPARNLSR